MTSVSWHGSTKIMTSYQMVWCHNRFYLKLWGTTIKLKKRFFVKFGGNLFFISTVFLFFFLNPIKSCRYVCFLVTLKTPHH